LVACSDPTIITKDENGVYHFNGDFRNAKDLNAALKRLKTQDQYAELVAKESDMILALFEEVFQHSSFTGRSGTFFAYEGLGSIYWHMVSKLLLAVQENYFQAVENGENESIISELAEKYYDIRSSLGFHKTPDVYGAFPTDPYSHTPAGQGAKQPGMTGQVKEELLTRLGEMGLFVNDGKITFHPVLLREEEFLKHPQMFSYSDVAGQHQQLELSAGSLAYTFCQTPIVYRSAPAAKMTITFADGKTREVAGNCLDTDLSRHLFQRDGHIRQVMVATDREIFAKIHNPTTGCSDGMRLGGCFNATRMDIVSRYC
jgi:hypothetical protein